MTRLSVKRNIAAGLGDLLTLTMFAALGACTSGGAGEKDLAFCAAAARNDAATAKALFESGQLNMHGRNLTGQCQPAMSAFGAARPQSPEFTAMAVALARQEGVATTCWTVPTGSSNTRSSGGTLCPIQAAARNANTVVMRALLDAGVDVKNSAAQQAMFDAIGADALPIVQMMVDAGADPNTGLTSAIGGRRTTIIAYLEGKGAREKVEPVLVAARRGDLAGIDAAIASRADLNVQDASGRTPLMRAATFGNAAVVARLARGGASVEHTMDGETALHMAARENQAAAVTALAAARANLNAHSGTTATPIEVAVNNGAVAAVRALVDAGADTNVFVESDTTVVGSAIAAGNLAMVRELLRGGARVNDRHGAAWRPPLHVTLGICALPPEGAGDNDNYRLTLMKTLVAAGADRTAKDAQGRTPAEAAAAMLAETNEPFRTACLAAKRDYLASLR